MPRLHQGPCRKPGLAPTVDPTGTLKDGAAKSRPSPRPVGRRSRDAFLGFHTFLPTGTLHVDSHDFSKFLKWRTPLFFQQCHYCHCNFLLWLAARKPSWSLSSPSPHPATLFLTLILISLSRRWWRLWSSTARLSPPFSRAVCAVHRQP